MMHQYSVQLEVTISAETPEHAILQANNILRQALKLGNIEDYYPPDEADDLNERDPDDTPHPT